LRSEGRLRRRGLKLMANEVEIGEEFLDNTMDVL
jgi:hypothetical protein